MGAITSRHDWRALRRRIRHLPIAKDPAAERRSVLAELSRILHDTRSPEMGCLACKNSRRVPAPGKTGVFDLVCNIQRRESGAGCPEFDPRGGLPPDPRGLEYDEPARLMHEARYVCRLRLTRSHHGYLDGVAAKRGDAARKELETAVRQQWKDRAGWMRPAELERARNA
ncbi:hypothetical protein LH427_01915 [Laribacter hongkongensis]|uniref:DUF7696 family protein n=1 Tax=Laribacter hongkongensis TaxID=168471 RepID=UPI001EFD9B80|nr:hypothetical protein [Laribacter hongkongensis]MCG8991798.1 hypothetical protein [Laribacter hongkongensis]MCG8998723.1 hypothetical protein [Laribacter hongkongensis]MCG9000203.1 hypothetical protein [Laribacter hongkongensis]MCG9004440.1 hypothetical protein [Laribacter hongkongensis]MCG9006593.1 hypothetical protein [Laribacter hongkongensis]